jgi:membrane-associated phospholipid phosphatase
MQKLLVFLILVIITNSIIAQNMDVRILHSINSSSSPTADNIFHLLSNTNTEMNLAIPAGISITAIVQKDTEMFKNACIMVAASAFNAGLTFALKYAINRERPFNAYPSLFVKKTDAGDPSFPSGHTSSAFATATSFSLAYPKWYVIVPSYLWAGSVAYSRLYLGAHYPSDVLGGIIVGSGCAYITYKANKWLNKKYFKHHAEE